MRWGRLSLVLAVFMVAGCASQPRLPAPPSLLNSATPAGFDPRIRIQTADRRRYLAESPEFFSDLQKAATDGSVDILSLSGGGAGGAFGAGALVGLDRAGHRPQFELVAGVSVGALIAPFAFLGPAWDEKLVETFSGERRLLKSPGWASVLRGWVFPRSLRSQHPLEQLVDRYVTLDLLHAVAETAATGRHLVVATTDLDRQETVLWDMGRIAARGGEPARQLFRDVLLASASIPGIYPPVVIRVEDRQRHYDELHADGSITTSLFTGPLVSRVVVVQVPELAHANVYLVVNGQLAARPRTTPLRAAAILASSFSAALTYKMRQDIAAAIDLAQRNDMHLLITEIPVDYPAASFVDFDPAKMKSLFVYGQQCAQTGFLWLTPEQSLESNLEGTRTTSPSDAPRCPAEFTTQRESRTH